ncbi:hypothetical protein D3C73_1386860 [compost metagenome]
MHELGLLVKLRLSLAEHTLVLHGVSFDLSCQCTLAFEEPSVALSDRHSAFTVLVGCNQPFDLGV